MSVMQTWAVQEAKARFSELLNECLAKGPQLITKRGSEVAVLVLVPVEVWRRLQADTKPSLKELLLSDQARGDLVLPERGRARRRVQDVLW